MEIVSRFDNKYNVLYFGAEIDFRLIPKNCSSTLKVLWSDLYSLPYSETRSDNPHKYYPNHTSSLGSRARAVKLNGSMWRDGALKFVIKRDPVERWLSVVNFAILMSRYGNYPEFSNLHWIGYDINDLAKYMRNLGIDNIHENSLREFYSQAYCGGDIEQYDHVFDIKEFDECKALMEDILGENLPDIHATVSKDKSVWKINDLTEEAISDIKVLYENDYINSWC